MKAKLKLKKETISNLNKIEKFQLLNLKGGAATWSPCDEEYTMWVGCTVPLPTEEQ